MNDPQSAAGRRAPLVLGVLALLLVLPLLGSFGLWDPTEVRVAEIAKEMAHTKTWQVPARAPGVRAPLAYWAMSAGYRFLGTSEIAGRLPIALLSLAALAAVFYAGSGLLRRRGAFLGSLALLTSPAFFLGARQLNTHAAAILASALAVGGLSRAAWPRREDAGRSVLHLALGVIGLVLGVASTGILLGVAVPLGAVAIGLLAASPSKGAEVPSDEPRPLTHWIFTATALLAFGAAFFAWWRGQAPGAHAGYSALIAGTPRAENHQIEFTTLLRQIGFGTFPWIALVPLAAIRVFSPSSPNNSTVNSTNGSTEDSPESSTESSENGADVESSRFDRGDYGRFVLLAWLIFAWFAQTLSNASLNEAAHFGGYGAIGLLAGLWLDEIWGSRELPIWAGIIAVLGAAVVAHDFLMQPEHWAGAHVLDGIKWPTPPPADRTFLHLHIPSPLQLAPDFALFIGLAWGALIGLACVFRPGVGDGSHDDASDGTSAPSPEPFAGRSVMLSAAMACAIIGAAGTIYWVVPEISQHLSYKGLFNKYKSLVGTGNSEIGKYHVPGQLSEYGNTTDISSLPQMFEFLAKPARVFVIVGADDLPSIDQYAKSRPEGQSSTYYVVDDTNSKFLMLSNQLGGQKDLNPLRRFVIKADQGLPKKPDHEVNIDFEGKVELVGYDLPNELERGQEFTIRMYYKVKQPLQSAYKVFIHFDGPGTRFNGDHTPLEGRFATNFWVPGFYVIDEHKMVPERATAPAGTYILYTGFWLGENRLKVTNGPNDGDQRAKLGTVKVK